MPTKTRAPLAQPPSMPSSSGSASKDATFLCAARHPGIGTAAWRAGLVHGALASDDMELRDAAIQAAEFWGDPGLREILADHSEPVSWLDEYRRGVMEYRLDSHG